MGVEACAIPSARTSSRSHDSTRGPSLREVVRPRFIGTTASSDSLSAPPRFSVSPYRCDSPIQGPPRRVSPVPPLTVRASRPFSPGGILRGVFPRAGPPSLGLRQSVAFAAKCSARLPQPFRADNLTGGRQGFTCVTGCAIAPSLTHEAFGTPLRTKDFSSAPGSATRRPRLTSAGLTPASQRQLGRTRHQEII